MGSAIQNFRRKTSFEVDFAKIEVVKEVLGTASLTETIDAALDEVINRRDRHALLDFLFTPGHVDLDDDEVMSKAWR